MQDDNQLLEYRKLKEDCIFLPGPPCTHSDVVSGCVLLRDRQLSYGADDGHSFAVVLLPVGVALIAGIRQLRLHVFLPVVIAIAVLRAASPERATVTFVVLGRLVKLEELRQHVVG